MLRNAWKEVENTDDEEDFEDTIWYYFQSSGKAYENTKKTINGKTYIFDEDGRMLFGWINDKDSGGQYEMADKDEDGDGWKDAVYYAGEADDGAVVTNGWRQIRVYEESIPTLKSEDGNADTGDYDYWFYFGSNGKKYRATSDSDLARGYCEKTIKSVKYAFAEDGHMASEWVAEASNATYAKYFSDPENGARVTKGWFKVVPSVGIDEKNSEIQDNEAKWFYTDSNGLLYKNAIKTINGKKYLFNNQGECLAGLRYINFEDGEITIGELVSDDDASDIINLSSDSTTEETLDKYTKLGKLLDYVAEAIAADTKTGIYYFAKPLDTDATMKTGTCNVTVDGESYAFKFKTDGANKGKGINGRDGNYYYVNGRKVTADSDNKFEIYEATINNKVTALYGEAHTADQLIGGVELVEDDSNGFAVVSTSGSIVKSGTKKDGDDYKITVKGYYVTGIKNSDDEEWDVDGTTVTYIDSKN